jgi:hypothetical protein
MEHVVSSMPTDATRRNPGILGPYYPDATHCSKDEAPGKPSPAASRSYDYENGPEGFPSAEFRGERRAGLPDAFARRERATEEQVSR